MPPPGLRRHFLVACFLLTVPERGAQVQLDPVNRNPWRLRLNLLPNEPVTLRSGTQRGEPGAQQVQHCRCPTIRFLPCLAVLCPMLRLPLRSTATGAAGSLQAFLHCSMLRAGSEPKRTAKAPAEEPLPKAGRSKRRRGSD